MENETKRPGAVLFAAILNFVGAIFWGFWGLLCAFALILGSATGVYQAVIERVSQDFPQAQRAGNLTFILTAAFGFFFLVSLLFTFLSIFLGTSLLKGKKYAWYWQVVLSVLGLFGFPIGTLLGIVILVFFFQNSVRSYFHV